jgi:hypothetical protein
VVKIPQRRRDRYAGDERKPRIQARDSRSAASQVSAHGAQLSANGLRITRRSHQVVASGHAGVTRKLAN